MDTLFGITFGDWWQLLAENGFRLDWSHSKRIAALTAISVINSRLRRKEQREFGSKLDGIHPTTPIFVLGHWRSGTTLLHRLLSLDPQFATPNGFQVTNPHAFLTRETQSGGNLPHAETRTRPMDNVEYGLLEPAEHETALAIMSLRSVQIGWAFPQRELYYDRFLTFSEADAGDVERWRRAMSQFLQKLTYRYPDQTLLLKSPADTGRIRLLLELYPDARFITIARNPYDVFRSTQKLYAQAIATGYLQRPPDDVDAGIVRRYALIHEAYFAQVGLIPAGRHAEIRFESLEQDFVGEMERIYHALGLGGWQTARASVEAFARESAGYRKNVYTPLPDSQREQIYTSWRQSFERWGYPA